MSLIREKSNHTNITRYYSINQAETVNAAVVWISDIRGVKGVSTEYIYFSDLNNRSDEGSESIQLDASISLSDMEKYINERSIDIIHLTGSFNGHPVVIGVDIHERLVYITIRKKDPADISTLEITLNLI